jgi:carnitine O-palmitoyltransferase 2
MLYNQMMRHAKIQHKHQINKVLRCSLSSVNKNYLHETNIPTYYFQDSLPKIPIPPLEDTVKRYIASAKPLLTEEEFQNTSTIADEFLKGKGKELQDKLISKDKSQYTSYYNEYWGDMYLEDRNTLLRHTPYIGWADVENNAQMEQGTRATNLIISSLIYFRTLRDEKLNPIIFHQKPKYTKNKLWETFVKLVPRNFAFYAAYAFGAVPIDMTNMKKMFHATRIPQKDIDTTESYPNSKHILVQRGTNFYTFDVLDEDGDLVDEHLIAKNIDYILNREEFDDSGPSIGSLTLWDRTSWSNTRERLVNTLNNKDVMEKIDSSIFAVCLEDAIPEKKSEQLLRMLCGSNGKNRWHDKSFQIVIRPDGTSCLTFEHSWGDGVAVLSYLTEVHDHIVKTKIDNTNIEGDIHMGGNNDHTVKKLTFNTDEELVKDTEKAEKFVSDFIGSLDGPSFTEKCRATSSVWAKQHKLSPDAVAQLAFQLGHSKLNGYPVATYEAAQTSFFKHGRTETIRSCTSASKEMCEIFLNPDSTMEERSNSLVAAAKYHSKLASEAQRGNGWDRHLFALRKLADARDSDNICNSSEDIPFFQDFAYKKLSNIIISTSTLGNIPQLQHGGFNPTGDDCYAIGYQVNKECMEWMITSHIGKNSQDLCDKIEEAMLDFEEAMRLTKKGNGRE